MKIKICGLFREEDIDYVNEARPDYCGFVFAPSKRQVSPALAARLRRRLADGIAPVGVFIDAPATDIAALYRDGVISLAQLHGTEDEAFVALLKEENGATPIPVIKVIKSESLNTLAQRYGGKTEEEHRTEAQGHREQRKHEDLAQRHGGTEENVDYYLLDSGAGSGKTFNWDLLKPSHSPFNKPWFLAGGIGIDNIEQAMALNPFAIDVSSGAETHGVKDREKILRLTEIVRKGNKE